MIQVSRKGLFGVPYVIINNNMPTYVVKNKKTEEEKEIFCSYEKRNEWLKENPDWIGVIGTPSSLRKLHRQFGDFVRGARSKGVEQFRIERQFILLLESIHPSDALIVLKMINKEQPAKYLTKNLAIEVWPGLIKK